MKTKLVILILSLLVFAGCYKSTIYGEMPPVGYFNDTIELVDTTYYMCCNANREEVELYFARKIKWRFGTSEINLGDKIYYKENYTVSVYNEDYRYTPSEFRNFLLEKNRMTRDTTIFRFTPNMYCSWDVFDKIYKVYIK